MLNTIRVCARSSSMIHVERVKRLQGRHDLLFRSWGSFPNSRDWLIDPNNTKSLYRRPKHVHTFLALNQTPEGRLRTSRGVQFDKASVMTVIGAQHKCACTAYVRSQGASYFC